MNEGAGLWITPLALLPGVGLLVMSTAARYGQLHAEIHHHVDHAPRGADLPGHLLERATRLRNALVSLYGAVALLAIASLAGVVVQLWEGDAMIPVVALTSVSVLGVALAAYWLVQESRMLLEIIHAHLHAAEAAEPPSAATRTPLALPWLTDPAGVLDRLLPLCTDVQTAASLGAFILGRGRALRRPAVELSPGELAVLMSLALETREGIDVSERYAEYGELGASATAYGQRLERAFEREPLDDAWEARLAAQHLRVADHDPAAAAAAAPRYVLDIGRDFS